MDDLSAYVASADYREAGDRLWQSLFAFSLLPDVPRPGAEQIEGLRAFRLADDIDRREPRLRAREGRDAALAATVALPHGVAPPPAGDAATASAGSWA